MDWIKVEDRLPTKEHKIIVCLINGNPILANVHDAPFYLKKSCVSFYFPKKQWVKDDYFAQVTHWMPLPNPPNDI